MKRICSVVTAMGSIFGNLGIAMAAPEILVSKISISEGDAGQTSSAVFDVSLSETADVDVTVLYETVDLDATAGEDYEASSGTVTIPAGELSRPISVSILGDDIHEGDETFAISYSSDIAGDPKPARWAVSTAIPSTPRLVGPSAHIEGGEFMSRGAENETFPNGSANVFRESHETGIWTLEQSLTLPTFPEFSRFVVGGQSDKWAVVGAIGNDRSLAGFFLKDPETDRWRFQVSFPPPEGLQFNPQFGSLAAISGETAALPEFRGDAVYVYESFAGRDGTWGLTATLRPDSIIPPTRVFGESVAIVNGSIAVSAQNPQAVYIFEQSPNQGDWAIATQLTGTGGTSLGGMLAASDGNLITAAYGLDGKGLLVVYRRDEDGFWLPQQSILTPDSKVGSFGFNIAVDKGLLAVSGRLSESGNGVIYIYGRGKDRNFHLLDAVKVSEDRRIDGCDVSGGRIAVSESGRGVFLAPVGAVATITEDDAEAPKVITTELILSESIPEGSFTIMLDQPARTAASVNFSVEARSAEMGLDFVATSGKLKFAPDSSIATGAIPIVDDFLGEGTEHLIVRLSNPQSLRLPLSAIRAAVEDNEPSPLISISNATCDESARASSCLFRVRLSEPHPQPITLTFDAESGTALIDTDFTLPSSSITIPANEIDATITAMVTGDSLPEKDEIFTLHLRSTTAGTIFKGSGTGTILDNDPYPSLSASFSNLQEGDVGNSKVSVHFTLSSPAVEPVSFDVSTEAEASSASEGVDYLPFSGNVLILAGQRVATIEIDIVGDEVEEIDENIALRVTNIENAIPAFQWWKSSVIRGTGDHSRIQLSGNTALMRIPRRNSQGVDTPYLRIYRKVGNVWQTEQELETFSKNDMALDGDTFAIVGVRRVEVFKRRQIGDWYREGILTEQDLGSVENVALSGDTLAFSTKNSRGIRELVLATRQPDGSWKNSAVIEDPLQRRNKSFAGAFSLHANTIAVLSSHGDGIVYIYSRKGSAWDEWALEQTLTNAVGGDTFGSQIALSGDGLLVGAPGAPGESLPRGVGAAFFYTRSSSAVDPWLLKGVWRGMPESVGDGRGWQVFVGGGHAVVGSSRGSAAKVTGSLTVYRSEGQDWTQAADLFVTESTDFEPIFAQDVDAGTIVTRPIGDATANELVQFYDATLVQIPIDDDELPLIIADAVEVEEPPLNDVKSATLTIQLSSPFAAGPITLRARSIDGTAVAETHFRAIDQEIVIPAGQARISLPITILHSEEVATTSFSVQLNSESRGTIAASEVQVTIRERTTEAIPVASIVGTRIVEGKAGAPNIAEVTVSLSHPHTVETTLAYSTSEQFGSAEAGNDFLPTSGTLQFAPGEVTKKVSVEIVSDDVPEANEVFSLRFTDTGENFSISGEWNESIRIQTPSRFPRYSTVALGEDVFAFGGSDAGITIYENDPSTPLGWRSAFQFGFDQLNDDRIPQFGEFIAISQQTVIVGGISGLHDLRIYEPKAGGWAWTGTINPEENRSVDQVLLDGDTAVIATGERNYSIFERNRGGLGNWGKVNRIELPGDRPIAASAQLAGDLLVIGDGYRRDSDRVLRPVIEIYCRDHGGSDKWGLMQELVQQEEQQEVDRFGRSIALGPDGRELAVLLGSTIYLYNWKGSEFELAGNFTPIGKEIGAIRRLNDDHLVTLTGGGFGSLCVFHRENDTWQVDGVVTHSPDTQLFSTFSHATSGSRIAIGSEASQAGGEFGSVVLFERNHANVTIVADERTPFLTLEDTILDEGDLADGSAIVPIVLSEPSPVPIAVHFESTPLTAQSGRDYEPVSGTITIPELTRARPIEVPIIGDHVPEHDETFGLRIWTDDGYGLSKDSAIVTIVNDDWTVLFTETTPFSYFVPSEELPTSVWTAVEFDDSSWTQGKFGIGYDTGQGYDPWIETDVEDLMSGKQSSIFVRIDFELDDIPKGEVLLRMRYEDGFAAYLNGTLVSSDNAPEDLNWQSRAVMQRDETRAVAQSLVSLGVQDQLLRIGRNVLSIHGLNASVASSDFLLSPELVARGAVGATSNYTVWANEYLADFPLASGIDDDPDGDSLTNGIEYAFGSLPGDSQSIAFPLQVYSNRIDLLLPSPLPKGVLYQLQSANRNLEAAGWTTIATLDSDNDIWEGETVPQPTNQSGLFTLDTTELFNLFGSREIYLRFNVIAD